MEPLGDALPKELARNRELLQQYAELGPVGNFARMMIEQDIKAADKAMIEGDLVGMIRAYEALRNNQ
jgi:hypothetical protein